MTALAKLPIISIVTPSFGQLEFLRLCLRSVADQVSSQFLIEHIVQDGGTPGFSDFAQEHIEIHTPLSKTVTATEISGNTDLYKVRFSSEPDRGMYDAINKGFAKSSGSICAWLNCDEQYLPGTLEKVSARFKGTTSDVLIGDTILVNENLKPRAYRKAVLPSADYIQVYQMNLHSSSMFFRASSLARFGPLSTTYRSISDAEWFVRWMRGGATISTFPTPLSVFVLGGENLSIQEISAQEKSTWLAQLSLSPTRKAWLKVHNVLRRMLAGAYLPRRQAVSIYTGSASVRQNFGPTWLDFRFRTN